MIAGSSGKALIILIGATVGKQIISLLLSSSNLFISRFSIQGNGSCVMHSPTNPWFNLDRWNHHQFQPNLMLSFCFQYIFIICFSLQVWKTKALQYVLTSFDRVSRVTLVVGYTTNINSKRVRCKFCEMYPLTAKESGPFYPTHHGKPTTNLRKIASRPDSLTRRSLYSHAVSYRDNFLFYFFSSCFPSSIFWLDIIFYFVIFAAQAIFPY